MPGVTKQEALPDTIAALRALVLTAWAERDAERAEKGRLLEERDQLAGQNDRWRHLIRQLQRMQFGRRSERLDPDQLNLALEDLEQAMAEGEAEQEKTEPALKRALSEKRRAGRGPFPEHLPRVEVVVEPEDIACPCCGGAMHVIGEDCSTRLDVIPAQYQVIVTRRPKYACRHCQEAVAQAPAPARLIEGGLPTERLVAPVVVAKYADHCPLYPRLRSWRGRASPSSGRPWPSGPAEPVLGPAVGRTRGPPPRSGPCGGGCARNCCTRRSCLSTRRRRRFSIRVGGGPRRGISGRSPATTGRGRAAVILTVAAQSAAKRAGRPSMAASLGGDAPAYPSIRFAAFPNLLAQLRPPQMAKVELSRYRDLLCH
jgi:transposase